MERERDQEKDLGASQVAQVVKKPLLKKEMEETRVQSQDWEDPLEKEMQPTPVFLPGESHGQRSLVGYSPKGCKGRTRLKRLRLEG